MKILTFTSLYPNAVNPQHGIFVENRLRKLVETGEVDARVIAPIQSFPVSFGPLARYSAFAAAPRVETRHGIEIHHPRFLSVPKVGMRLTRSSMAIAARKLFRDIVEKESIDLIDAHYFYPDGVAAATLAAETGVPCVITGRGTDLNLFPEFPAARREILKAVEKAVACVTVSDALRNRLIEIGAPAEKVTTLRNGVDTELFAPVSAADRDAIRRRHNLTGRTIIAVGNLAPEKGQMLIAEALRAQPELADVSLLLVGDGPDGDRLDRFIEDNNLAGRVRRLGRVPQSDLPGLYSVADVSVLASMREGWPNVLLESMACGTPVVAADVGGVREMVTAPEAGVVVGDRTAGAFAAAIAGLLEALPDRASTRRHAEGFSWEETTRGQIDLFRRILDR
ncbi:MAG: teichuronic acid biosynthesis glycosyltransferase TuaC [Alphaproteobacteria bacterium]